jgi:hypothetical protein
MLAISFFVIAIVYITYIAVSSMIKILNTAYKRKEISKRNYRLLVISSVLIGIFTATILPLGFIKLFEFII